MTYNGVFYSWGGDFINGPPPGTPFASTLEFDLSLESPDLIITGPGTYPQTYGVQLNFCLSASTADAFPPFNCETDTGTATGAWNATFGNFSFVFLPGGLDLTITPEPSTLSYVGFALCFGVFVAKIGRLRRPPAGTKWG